MATSVSLAPSQVRSGQAWSDLEADCGIGKGRGLIDTVIELVETAPLQQLTVRNIANHAGTDPKTIFRNFESLEDLFVASVRELEQRMRRSLEAGEGDLRPVAPAIPYVRLTTWLYLSGTPIEKLQGSPEATAIHRALTLGDLDSRSDLSERTKATLFLIMSAFLAGQATVGQFQPQVFPPVQQLMPSISSQPSSKISLA